MYEQLIVRGLIEWLVKHYNQTDRLEQIKKYLVKLHDFIEVIFPEIAESDKPKNAKRIESARKTLQEG